MATSTRKQVFKLCANEGNSSDWEGTLADKDGPIALSEIITLTLSLSDRETGTPINGRDSQDVLNDNNVTVDVLNGLMEWAVQPEDNIIVPAVPPALPVAPGDIQPHVATFICIYNNGGAEDKQISHIFYINVVSLSDVP